MDSANSRFGTTALDGLESGAGRVRVICLGLSALDQIWRVERLLAGSEKIRSLDHATLGGGMAANAAVAVARLGGAATFWGRGGDDAAGREMRAALAAEGIDVENFRLFADGRSSVSGVIVDRTGERQIVNFRGHFPAEADWLPLDDVANASAVLADPRWPEGAVALFTAARALGIPTVLDGDVADAEIFERLLPLTDHAVFSEPALAAFAGTAGWSLRHRVPLDEYYFGEPIDCNSCTISIAAKVASWPLLPALPPARSKACSIDPHVRTPKVTGRSYW